MSAARHVVEWGDRMDVEIDLAVDETASDVPVSPLPEWIERSGRTVRVRGDATLERDTYLSAGNGKVRVATTLPELLGSPGTSDRSLSRVGVSHVLGSGFVPLPLTIFAGVHRLGAGDSAEISAGGEVAIESDYPWINSKSRQDQTPNPDRLLELMTASLERKLAACRHQGLLMMSSGKDSVGVAVALAELGYDIPCVTYRADPSNVEHEHAARFCKKLGLRHEVVSMPDDADFVRDTLLHYFSTASAPCADHALIPFVTTVAQSGVRNGGIIDGGGNDGYMGYIPTHRRRLLRKFRLRGRWLHQAVARVTPVDSKLNYAARGRSASALPGRNLRFHEIKRVFGGAADPAVFWREVDRGLAGQSDLDRAMRNMFYQLEGSRTPDKARRVAEAYGMTPVFPYCDEELARYYFNLPQLERFSLSKREEKRLLAQLLADRLGYNPEEVGSGFFAFDGASFFAANAEFVREEVRSCSLWEPAMRVAVDDWLESVSERPFLFHVLLSVFVLSGWYNHNPLAGGVSPR